MYVCKARKRELSLLDAIRVSSAKSIKEPERIGMQICVIWSDVSLVGKIV